MKSRSFLPLIVALGGSVDIGAAEVEKTAEPPEDGAVFRRFFEPGTPAVKGSHGGTGAAPGAQGGPAVHWKLFPRGGLPEGTVLGAIEAKSLPAGDYVGKPTYLTGEFIVTAAVKGRAVLRAADPNTKLRVSVECPAESALCVEGMSLVIDASCECTRIRMG